MSWINTNSEVHYWNTKDGGLAYQFGVKNGGQPLYLHSMIVPGIKLQKH